MRSYSPLFQTYRPTKQARTNRKRVSVFHHLTYNQNRCINYIHTPYNPFLCFTINLHNYEGPVHNSVSYWIWTHTWGTLVPTWTSIIVYWKRRNQVMRQLSKLSKKFSPPVCIFLQNNGWQIRQQLLKPTDASYGTITNIIFVDRWTNLPD